MDIVAYQPPAGDDMEARPVSDDAPPVKNSMVRVIEYEYKGRMVKSFEYEYQPPNTYTYQPLAGDVVEARHMSSDGPMGKLILLGRSHFGLNKKPLKTIEEDKVYKSRRKPNAM